MHHYAFHPGDYLLDTAHLGPMEDLAYRRLLDLYYTLEAPIPAETGMVSRRLRLDTEIVNLVLSEFFELREDGWHQPRCDAEIAEYHRLADVRKRNGSLGGRPKKTGKKPAANLELTCSPPASLNQKPETRNQDVTNNMREASPSPTGPPTEAQAIAYAANGSTVAISRECVLRWLTDREVSNWLKPKGNHMIEILPNWQADLRGYAMDWNKIDQEKAARNAARNQPQRGGGYVAPTKF